MDYATRPPFRVTEIAGTAGLLRLDILARKLWRFDLGGALVEEKDFGGAYADDYRAEMMAFLASAAGKAEPPCDGW